MRRICCFLLICLLVGLLLAPTVAALLLPANQSLATARAAIAAAVGTDTAGAAVTVIEGGEPLMTEGFGYADIASGALVTPDTVFEIGELSALFVTVAALRLAEEGTVSLDADVTLYLNEEVTKGLALRYPVTLRQLLAGQGGFGGRMTDISYDKEKYCFETLAEAVLTAVPEQVAAPGTVTSDSPFGLALLALAIEGAVGVSFNQYVTDTFLQPLGMKNTYLTTAGATLSAPATGYTLGEDGRFYTDAGNGRRFAGLAPATGAATTLADLQRLLTWLLLDGDTLLSATARATLRETVSAGMLTVGATPLTPLANGALTLKGQTDCFSAVLVIDLAAKNAAAVLANTPETTLVALPNTLFGGENLPLTLPKGDHVEDLKSLRGTYLATDADLTTFVGRLAALDAGVSVQVKEDTLYLGDTALVQIARGVFAAASAPEEPLLQFLLDEDGVVTALLHADGTAYTAAPALRTGLPARAAFAALLVLGALLLFLAVFGFFRWLSDVDRKGRRDSILPPVAGVLAALTALFAGAQVLLAFRRGAAAISSAYFAWRILVLLAGIAAMVLLVLAFITTVFNRRTHRHIALSGIVFVLFFLLCIFFGLTVM
ncbi:MAG: beta-lactamase family protein [Clostridia bacterium]|nr:beta-lactamase family protein [Clostridia bacterium]